MMMLFQNTLTKLTHNKMLFDHAVSRWIIDIPWLHTLIVYGFIMVCLLTIAGFMWMMYKLMKVEKTEKIVWTYEGKGWDYWKNKR